ncbi:uncharacterized protein LOC129249291 isoform X1 [Anastrepha obliqua]|uniref:uncharacterized protein LOC129249291 isoform X1 n=1 Tax=Anastrepha obliqua TaxID=95512 RepID=UPI002409F9D1|nr:uncharacterized protein LOC129249291 isoform X1 [Anastrepha obliqua]
MRPRRKEKSSSQKISRWDRIRKRNVTKYSFSINSDIVENLFGKEYINQSHELALCGKCEPNKILDPLLVMDMRHEMFRKIPRKLPTITVSGRRTLDACISHNQVVESRYITNELKKFRQQLQKNYKKNMINGKLREKTKKDIYNLDNEKLMQSLERTGKHIANFYAAPLEALQVVNQLCDTEKSESSITEKVANEKENNESLHAIITGKSSKKEIYTKKTCAAGKCLKIIDAVDDNIIQFSLETVLHKGIELQTEETEFKSVIVNGCTFVSESNLGIEGQLIHKDSCECRTVIATNDVIHNSSFCQARCVRFDESVEVRNFNQENSICSNTSDGIDSVVSDIAEETLFELPMGAEEKLSKETGSHTLSKNPSTTSEFNIHLHDTQTPQINGNSLEPLIIKGLTNPKQLDPEQTTSEDMDEESNSNYEQNLIIEQLFQSRANTNHTLLRKYFLKWIHFITIEKIEREDVSSKGERIHKINLFLDKIRKEKLRLTRKARQCTVGRGSGETQMKPAGSTQVTKKYQNKIKIQQDIIDLQRLKLERQERIIMELKLNKLSDAAKEDRQDLKNVLNSFIQHGDHKFKAKAKCVQLIGNLRDEKDENMTNLQGKAMNIPKFLMEMQERALERNIRHEKARQRRLQQEAEKEAQKMAAEEAKRLEDEEAKRLRIEVLKEKRRQEKMAKVLKEREYQRAEEAKCKADEFYRRLLLRRIGMEGFKRVIRRKYENKRKCEQLRRNIFKRTYFLSWRDYYLKLRNEKLALADELYDKFLKRKILRVWQLHAEEERCKLNTALDWCDFKRTEMAFKCWAQYSMRMWAIDAAKMNQAKSHHEWHLKWKVLDCWQRLPQILQLERETEERRQRWRMKIWELLPDYTPNRDYP